MTNQQKNGVFFNVVGCLLWAGLVFLLPFEHLALVTPVLIFAFVWGVYCGLSGGREK